MTQIYLYAAIGIAIGIAVGWLIQLFTILRIRKREKSLQGFFETEKLIRERLQKENTQLLESRETLQADHDFEVQRLQAIIKTMDEDILLMQKSNEETEALLKETNPMVHALKLKLIEANNTIARYKAQLVTK